MVTVGQKQPQALQLAILSSHKQRGNPKVIPTVLAGPFLQEHLHYLSGTLKGSLVQRIPSRPRMRTFNICSVLEQEFDNLCMPIFNS